MYEKTIELKEYVYDQQERDRLIDLAEDFKAGRISTAKVEEMLEILHGEWVRPMPF
jgi:hypothetical protein